MAIEKKYQVFISSTFLDLKVERQAAVEAILSMGHIPAGMELFAASNKSQWEVIKKWIDASDVYMLILGARYGTVNTETQLSYTHMEYEYALKANKPLFAVIIKDEIIDLLPNNFVEKDNKQALTDFRALVSKNLIAFYEHPKDIENAIFRSLNTIRQDYDLVGWVKGDQYDANIAKELAKVSEEARNLREENQKLKDAQAQRIPDLTLVLNKNQALKFKYNVDGIKHYSNPLPITNIPKHLAEYTDQKKVEEYNQIIQHNTPEKIQEFNSMMDEAYAYEHLGKIVEIELSNEGTAIANNVEISIKFPDFIKVFENQEELDDYKINHIEKSGKILQPLIENPLEEAKERYKAKDFYRKSRLFNTVSATSVLGLNRHSNSLLAINPIKIPKVPKINSSFLIKDNIVRLNYPQFLHSKKIRKSIILVPLATGEGNIQIIIHCAEYLKPKILELPITIE